MNPTLQLEPPTSTVDDFTAYVHARSAALLRVAYLITGHRADAEDLLQTALSKLYLAWERIEDKRVVDAYVRRILVNTHTSGWRRRRMDEYPTDELPEPPADRDHYAQRDQQDELWWALNRLTARQRSVVVMRYYLDLSEAETAAELGVSKGTVKSTLHHAMSRLRTELGRSGDTEAAGRELAEVRSVPAARVPLERELALAG